MTPARPGRKRLFGLALTLLAAAFAASLGVWQLRRLAWKEQLLTQLDAGRSAPARPLPEAALWASLAPDDYEYRRFVVTGRFEPAQTLVFAGPVTTDAGPRPGYFVMAPFVPDAGGRLMVHRGVVPLEAKGALAPNPEGRVTLTGLLRAPERGTWFTPADEPDKGAFFLRDPRLLAPALGAGLSPFFLDEEAAPGATQAGWPRKGVGTLSPPNNHLSYALTWFGLAATLLVVAGLAARRR
jgi:surfeit locus 1 family protein